MDILKNIFGNSAIQSIAFKKLKDTMKENNLTGIVVTMDENGELDYIFLKEQHTFVPTNEFNEMKKLIQSIEL